MVYVHELQVAGSKRLLLVSNNFVVQRANRQTTKTSKLFCAKVKMNLLHPLAIAFYVAALVAVFSLLSNRSAITEYFPADCIRLSMQRVTHALNSPPDPNTSVQLSKYASALALLSAMRTLAPGKDTIVRITRVDPSAVAASLQTAAASLLEQSNSNMDAYFAATST